MPEIREVINGRYEVHRQIASGGTSRVYLVADRHIGRILAMKVMDRKSFGAFRFAKREIESLRAVHYPLIPEIFDAFCDEENIYIVSEYVKGTSLAKLCMGEGLPRHRSLIIARQICEALIYLHGMKEPLLYLDLKPENIIISDDGKPHLIDFGIAGWLAAHHMSVGTIGYSPPEQYKKGGIMDERTDIFAFGMTYFAIRSGVPPDPAPKKALDDIRHFRTFCSSEKAFLAKCCAPLQEDRYTSAKEVLRQINHIRSIPERIRKTIAAAAVAAGIITAGAFAVKTVTERSSRAQAAAELVAEATQHMKDGQYTPEGIGIIKAYISSGRLPESCEQDFIFEVAVNSLLAARDYRTAAYYFSRLDEDRFPEARDYEKLCRLQNSFSGNTSEAYNITEKMFSDISRRPPSKLKYENMIFVADCFEQYDDDPEEGIAKAVSVLKMGMEELDETEGSEDEMDPDERMRMRERLSELAAVKEKRLRTKKMIGEKDEKKEDK